MSCKVLPPEDAQPSSPHQWRQVAKDPRSRTDLTPGSADRMAEVERECERRVHEARAAGVREGEEAGRRRAVAELQPQLERLARSAAEISAMRTRLRKEAEEDLVGLSIAIARRVLRREITVDPEALRGVVRAALEKLEAREISRLWAHPSQAQLLTACLREAGATAVEVIADPSREPGAVVFESSRGDLDASVETQLREIERGLADRLRRRE
jgi:flagellar assembly protein FliH